MPWFAWLRRHYSVRALPLKIKEFQAARHKESLRILCLADPAKDDPAMLHAVSELRMARLIGFSATRPAVRGDRLRWFMCLPAKAPRQVVESVLAAAFQNIELAAREAASQATLARTEREMEQLHEIGIALPVARDVQSVLALILRKAREITGADAGSVYVVEERRLEESSNGEVERTLRFKLAENDSVDFPAREITLPISEQSIAGFVALHGAPLHIHDAYRIPPEAPYRFNDHLDRELGYRTRSILTLPMRNGKGEVLGVLQLINCKRDPRVRLANARLVTKNVQPFPPRALRMALSLASQAAVSYENSKLYHDIEQLFEGFVRASITAIEQRDPTTSGHSLRVSDMTCGLAETVNRTETGSYALVRFTPEQMKEIRYAALLHDFGKVAVREEVLVKAKKLYPSQLAIVQNRFDYVRKEVEACYVRQKLDLLVRLGADGERKELERLEREMREKFAELDEAYSFVLRVNEPTVMPEGNFDRLHEIARRTFHDPRGREHSLLTSEEVRFLSISKGSLDQGERELIESHVVHTFNFLMQIPWTREIREIPFIARAHHEKLNGTGYPNHIKASEIPVQAKIMTICDIFDALSASDRPYKKAVSPERALDILQMSVRDNELDPALYRLFVDAKVYELMHRPS
jgi:HD-GYP domain-containing protein (c-di-GMP phosphodiesterase class II)